MKQKIAVGDIVTVKETEEHPSSSEHWICIRRRDEESQDNSGPLELAMFNPFNRNTKQAAIMNLNNGHTSWENDRDLVRVPDEDVEKRIRDVAAAKEEVRNTEYLKPNSMVELKYDVDVLRRMMFFTYTETLPKGTTLVVTYNTEYDTESKNIDPEKTEKMKKERERRYGKYQIADLVFPRVSFYSPEEDNFEDIHYSKVTPKKFEENPEKLISLPKGYWERINTVLSRVLNTEWYQDIYSKLGLSNFCQKGKGAIFLLYGPPGTGKTMTAEVVAEKVKRPLIRVNLGNVMNTEGVMDRLEGAFKRAKQFNAVLLLDEVDVFIRKRGENPFFDENTAVFLKTLERYDGILFLTTNLVTMIDPAIFSRIHGVFEYEAHTIEERKVIWRTMLQSSVLKYVVGTEEQHEAMFDELSKVDINGREVKTAIQNAVTHAIAELKGKPLPEMKWIPKKYFLEEANEIAQQREALKGV